MSGLKTEYFFAFGTRDKVCGELEGLRAIDDGYTETNSKVVPPASCPRTRNRATILQEWTNGSSSLLSAVRTES